jgi:outer membrane protein TolC
MKTKIPLILLILIFSTTIGKINAQTLQVSPELRELIGLSMLKDRKVNEVDIDRQIAGVQKKAVKAAYIPKLELGGKYVYAYSSINSKIGNVEGFESLAKLQELMKSPAFPSMFPGLAGLAGEITQLETLLSQQGLKLPAVTNNLDGDLYGNYFGIDASVRMLIYSGGQVPNLSRALDEKIKVEEALSDKYKSDIISEVITCYDQLALLIQSKRVLDESALRLAAENKYAVSALKNGLATSFDTLKLAVAKASLTAKISEYESRKNLLNQKLSQLTGKPAETFDGMSPELQLLLYANQGSDITNRAEFRALDAGVEAQKYLLKSEKSHSLPKVQALASARYDNIFNARTDINAPLAMNMKINNIGIGPTYMVGAGFKWEIFDRSGGSARVRQAKLEVLKAENSREEARELLELNQTRVTSNYQASISQVTYKDKQRTAARMALDLAEKSYNEGMINITERLATETDMQNAELEYLQAEFAQRQAALECYKATGDLTLANIR